MFTTVISNTKPGGLFIIIVVGLIGTDESHERRAYGESKHRTTDHENQHGVIHH